MQTSISAAPRSAPRFRSRSAWQKFCEVRTEELRWSGWCSSEHRTGRGAAKMLAFDPSKVDTKLYIQLHLLKRRGADESVMSQTLDESPAAGATPLYADPRPVPGLHLRL